MAEQPKTKGISARKVWKFRVVNPALVERQFMMPNERAIGAFVRAQGAGAVGMIPGVEVYSEISVAGTGY